MCGCGFRLRKLWIADAAPGHGNTAAIARNADGLFTAVVQERGSGDVLMVAWLDDDALARDVLPEDDDS